MERRQIRPQLEEQHGSEVPEFSQRLEIREAGNSETPMYKDKKKEGEGKKILLCLAKGSEKVKPTQTEDL